MARDWTNWELGIINLNVHFFLRVREFFVLHRMVGRTWRGVLTPVYFEPCNFPSIITPKALCSGIEWHILAIGASQVALVVKNPPANAGDKRDASSNPGSGRSPGEGNGILFQHSCWENPMDRGAWRAPLSSHTRLNL